jgi:hypothetical protein
MMSLTNSIKKIRAKIRHILIGHLSYEHLDIQKNLEMIKFSIGKHEARSIKNAKYSSIQEAEFKVFSQFGEDGIIQYLINKIQIPNKIFIELGVGDYSESNTRFLLMNNSWQGKIVNSGTEHIEYLQSDTGKEIYYRYTIDAISEFITKDNVNKLIRDFNVPKDIGLLSIDIDGVDYWIWDTITTITPRIVIIEYNSHFGSDFSITVPYKKDFDRIKEHYSGLYFGTSLAALCTLAKQKGYQFVGSNSAGVNAFFVRNDVADKLPKLTAKKGYVKSSHRDSLDQQGNFTYISDHKKRLEVIADKKVFDIQKNNLTTIRKLFAIN